MTEPGSRPIDLERTFGLMDVADELRRQRRRVEEHLATSDRDGIKAQLIERYRAMGHDADPELIDKAIDRVLAQAYRFRPPEPGLDLRLGRAWARRRQIARRLALPVVVVLALGGVGTTIVNTLNGLWYGRHERAVERRVADTVREADRVRARLLELEQTAPPGDLPPAARAELGVRLDRSRANLAPVDQFLGEFAPGGDPVTAVTAGNYEAVEARLPSVNASLGSAADALGAAATILDLGDEQSRALRLAAAARVVAAEPAALLRLEELSARIERQSADADAAGLGATADEIAALLVALEQEYTLRVVAGVERDSSRYYLVVQAVAADGRLIPMNIRNEENGRSRTVEEWAERVPREAYDAVGRDYEDDGVIDDDVFGTKRRGFLEPERRFANLGQITDW